MKTFPFFDKQLLESPGSNLNGSKLTNQPVDFKSANLTNNSFKPISDVQHEDVKAVHTEIRMPGDDKQVIMNMVNGKKDGPLTILNSSGSPEIIVNFKNNVMNGLTKMYNPNGSLEREINYQNGKINGQLIAYFDDGKVSMQMGYDQGKLNGKSVTYAGNGELALVSNYVQGILEGDMIIYSHGKPYVTKIYKNGIEIKKILHTNNIP